MQFSVLLSLYYKENATFLCQSLDSIFNQTLLPSEVLLVKDGALTPELDKVVAYYAGKHPEMKIVALSRNGGLGPALNEGLKHCSYDLVARMDTDDICKPHRFERQVRFMEQHPDVDVCGAWIDEFIDDSSNVVSTRKVPEKHQEIYKFGTKRCPVNHPVVMFRKRAVETAGNYQAFYLFEDYYLWIRMLMKGFKFHNLQDSLLLFRASPDMFQRRGGFKYAGSEVSFQWAMYKLGYANLLRTLGNICIRFIVRIMPNGLRRRVYKKLLR